MKVVYHLFAVTVLTLSFALAQSGVTLEAPVERFVAPGEFATFVFRVSAEEALSLQGEVTSEQGWSILRQPGELTLNPDKRQPVAVTVAVPEDAAAFTTDTLTLELSGAGRAAASVTLTVSEARELDLRVPREVVLGPEGVSVTVVNQGNVIEQAVLELRRIGDLIEARELSLEPRSDTEQTFNVTEDGSYSVHLIGEQSAEVTKTVNVIRFGVPAPEPFGLAAELSLGLSSSGDWETALVVEGPLSDFSTFGAQLSVPDWRDSFAELELERETEVWSVRLGKGYRSLFGLRFPADFGVAASYNSAAWTVGGAAAWVGQTKFSGYALGQYEDDIFSASAGLGMRSGRILAGARGQIDKDITLVQSDLSYRDGVLNASLTAQGEDDLTGVTADREVGVALNNLLTPSASLGVRAGYAPANLTLYGSANLPLALEATLDANVGISNLIPSTLPGQLAYGVQAGYARSFATLRYYTDLGNDWRTSNQAGLLLDSDGFGLSLDSFWSQTGDNFLSFDAQFAYYPAASLLKGKVGARAQRTFETLQLSANSGWDITNQSLDLSAASVWRDDVWRLEANANTSYSYEADARPWSFGLSLKGSYAFTLNVPESVTTLSGGRNLGTLLGQFRAADAPVVGVEVSVGRYRFVTDEAGEFRAELPPGSYDVRVDTTTLPITYRLQTVAETQVEISLQEETSLTLRAVETAALVGRVLQDSDADGLADDPAVGLEAQLFLSDAEGLNRVVTTREDGSFAVRGLVPGEVRLSANTLPLGSKVVGDTAQTLTLRSGIVTETLFLVQPASRTGRSFGGNQLRIRRVTPEVERVPPGLDPLVRVTVQGEADTVVLETPAQTVALSYSGDVWLGRISVPAELDAGVFNFDVVARRGETESTRQGQIVVDPEVAAFEISLDSPTRPGDALSVSVVTYFQAEAVTLSHPFGEPIALEEDVENPGRWRALLRVPENAEDKTHTLSISAQRGGASFEQEATFRVLVP